MNKPISVGFLPTTEVDDTLLSFTLLLKPWLWKKGEAIQHLEAWFQDYFGAKYTISFNSGRSAELAILKALNIGPGDEVLIQAFTCVAVPNSIFWVGATPIYVDVKRKSVSMDDYDLEKKITPQSKAIIVQHTFGIPDNMDRIVNIAKKHKLFLIEDCAHSLGAVYKNKKLGTFGDVAFFSFGRDKVISSVFGGMVVTNDEIIGMKLREFASLLHYPSLFWIIQQLLYPLVMNIGVSLYNTFNLGKVWIEFCKQFKIILPPVEPMEKKGKKPSIYPQSLPNAQAKIALHQLKKLEKIIEKRKMIVRLYKKSLQKFSLADQQNIYGLIRYPIISNKPRDMIKYAKKCGIILGRWYSNIIDPQGVYLEKIGYIKGQCPNAESVAKQIVNLPTSPILTEIEVNKVVFCIESYYGIHNNRN